MSSPDQKLFIILMKMNKTKIDISEIDTVILAGGLGTRLRSVLKDKPKCLAPINGTPFIDIFLDNCIDQGLRRFIICVGYLKEQVIEHLNIRNDCEIIYSEEDEPLGTGGAIKHAESFITSNPFFALNGDSYCEIDFKDLLQFHIKKNALITIVVTKKSNTMDYGKIVIDKNSKILEFSEKVKFQDEAYVNAGIYCMSQSSLNYMSSNSSFSIEHSFFPSIINKRCFAYKVDRPFLDIGTPERLRIAKQHYKT